MFAQIITSRRLDQFVSADDLRRLRATSPAEIERLIGRYATNRRDFDVPPDVAEKWQEFTTQMSRAGQGIENTFVRGLAPLAPGLSRLAESFEKVVRSFLSSPALEKWITGADQALEKFATYIGTPEFEHKVERFASEIANLADAAGQAAKWILSWFGGPHKRADVRDRAARARLHDEGLKTAGELRKERAQGKSSAWEQLLDIVTGGQKKPPEGAADVVSGLERRGFSREEAAAVTGNLTAESHLRTDAVNPASGAYGMEQLLGERLRGFLQYAKETGRKPSDREAQLDWIKLERSGESVRYGGSDERDTGLSTFSYPLAGNPGAATVFGSASYNVNMVGGYFQTSSLVYRTQSNQFEVGP